MNNTLRNWIYILISVLIFAAVVTFFISMLPFLLIGGVIIYVISRFTNKKPKENQDSSNSYQRVYENKSDYSEAYKKTSSANENNEKVIDVDFKDV